MTGGAEDARGGWLASMSLGVVAALVYLALPQRVLHGLDPHQFVVWIEQHSYAYPRHLAYLRIGGLFYAMVEPFGGNGFLALRLASALGAAVGALLLHRAFRRLPGIGARDAALLTAAVATAPAWLWFATTVEIPGVFAAGTGLAWWMFARFHARPCAASAALLGVGTAAAAAIHSFGHLLAPGMALVAWALGRRLDRAAFGQLVVLAAVHGAISLALPALLGAGASGQAADAVSHLEERWRTFAPLTAPDVFVREWIAPYLPWSPLAFAGLFSARARRWALAALVLLLLHLPFCVLLLGFHRIDEDGAYLLPLLPPAILCARLLLPRPVFVAAVVASAVFAVVRIAPYQTDGAPAGFVAGVAELEHERPVTFVAWRRAEYDAVRQGVRDIMAIELGDALGIWVQEHQKGMSITEWWDRFFALFERTGKPMLLSDSARAFLADNPDPEIAAFWRDHVLTHYLVVPERRQGFTGVWVLRH